MRSISCLYPVQSAFLRFMLVMYRAGDEVAVVCNRIRIDIWSELMVICVCYSDGVMREADAKYTSGELESGMNICIIAACKYVKCCLLLQVTSNTLSGV